MPPLGQYDVKIAIVIQISEAGIGRCFRGSFEVDLFQ